MSEIPDNLKYTKDHEWIDLGTGKIGITDYAQNSLSDVVYVELPETGSAVEQNASFAVVESVKSASDIYCPVAGKVTAVNSELEDHPEWINEEPYGKGWIAQIEISGDTAGLMDAAAYRAEIGE